MNKVLLYGLLGAVVIVFLFLHVETCPAKTTIVTIGTGGITGVYYPCLLYTSPSPRDRS